MSPSLLFVHSDARILDQIRRGDEEALVALYHANERKVTALVTKNSGTVDDAQDILQEALVVLWERVKTGRFEYQAQLGTFIFATARNLWMRRLARMRREGPTTVDAENTPDGMPSVLDEMIESEEAAMVSSALDELGEPCRTLLLLFYWEEQSMVQIAEKMHFANAETAKSKKYQCKKALENIVRRRLS